jgi:hypothetical protein
MRIVHARPSAAASDHACTTRRCQCLLAPHARASTEASTACHVRHARRVHSRVCASLHRPARARPCPSSRACTRHRCATALSRVRHTRRTAARSRARSKRTASARRRHTSSAVCSSRRMHRERWRCTSLRCAARASHARHTDDMHSLLPREASFRSAAACQAAVRRHTRKHDAIAK